MHYYSHHIGDLIRDTANLNDHQLATYMRMIWEYYSAEKPITGDMEDVAFAMRSDEKTIRLLLRHYFVECDDGWRHARCDREIALFHEKAEKASQSAKARWSNKQPQKMQEECDGNANASASDASARVLDANQEPRTKNQEPIKPKERKPNVASTTIDPIKTVPPLAVGLVEPEKGVTTFKAQLQLYASEAKALGSAELDVVRVSWSAGYEDYEIFDVDVLQNLFRCLEKEAK